MSKSIKIVLNKTIIIPLILALLLFSACSNEEEAPTSHMNTQNFEAPVSKNPTPEDEAIYLAPKGKDSPMEFKDVYDVVSLQNITAKKACEILGRIATDASFSEGDSASAFVIRTREDKLDEIKKLIKKIDKKAAQIMIESRILEISENELTNLGIDWNNGQGNFKIGYNFGSNQLSYDDITAVINALSAKGSAKVISSPVISTMDNSEADVNIGSRIPYSVPVNTGSTTLQWTVQYIDAGVSLKITPRLCDNGYISVVIHPEVSSISEWRTTQAGEFPVISTRNADATVRIKNGETIIIGGLIDESDRKNITKIPLAGDIPIIKELFTKTTDEKERTEIVFLITPHVI